MLIDVHGEVLAGRHRVEPTALFIHGAVHRITGHAVVLHCHMPYATALTLTADRALDPTLSQNAMRFMNRIAIDADYNGLALDDARGRAHRQRHGGQGRGLPREPRRDRGRRDASRMPTTTSTTWSAPACTR